MTNTETVMNTETIGMNTEKSREIVLAFADRFARGNMAAALALLADDATWWVAGQPGHFALAGQRGKAELPALFQWIGTALPAGVEVTIRGVTAEGGRVALEVEARGVSAGGGNYCNQIHFLFEVRDGHIYSVREYLDTQHVQDVLVGDH